MNIDNGQNINNCWKYQMNIFKGKYTEIGNSDA